MACNRVSSMTSEPVALLQADRRDARRQAGNAVSAALGRTPTQRILRVLFAGLMILSAARLFLPMSNVESTFAPTPARGTHIVAGAKQVACRTAEVPRHGERTCLQASGAF